MSVPSGASSSSETGFPSLESILGPFLLGALFSTMLWGVTCVQTYDYFTTPNDDRPWYKSVVALLCILDTFDTITNAHILYHYLVKNFGNPFALATLTWSASCRSLLIVLSSFIVCTMFARRIYLVSGKNIVLTSWTMAISSAHLVVGILLTVKSLMGEDFKALPSLTHLLYIAFSLGIATDVSFTVSLGWFLYSAKTGIRRTDSLVKVLMLYVVTTGLLIVVDATVGMICYIVMPDTLIYVGFFLLLGKLYTNAFLASLNARGNLRKGQSDVILTLARTHPQNRQSNIVTDDDTRPNVYRSDMATSQIFMTKTNEQKNLSTANVV